MQFRVSIVSFVSLLLLALQLHTTFAQGGRVATTDASSPVRVRFDHLNVEQGLSQGSVGCMMQDARGLLWIGTDDGLNRFDGYEFLVFRSEPRNPRSLVSSVINALAEDARGGIWVGTGGAGFQYLPPGKREFLTPSMVSSDGRSLARSVVTALQVDRRQRVWIGTERDGLHVYDPATKSLNAVALSDDGGRQPISCITSTRSGRILVASRGMGLSIVDEDSLAPSRLSLPAAREASSDGSMRGSRSGQPDVLQVLVEADRYLWITTDVGSLLRHDVRTGRWKEYRLPAPDGAIYSAQPLSMALDSEERLWLGTRSSGLLLFDTRRGSFHRVVRNALDPEALPGNSIRCVYRDRSGNMWIGTNGNGIGLHSPVAKDFHLIAPGTHGNAQLPVHSFRAIWQDSDSVLWLGGYGGFCRIDMRTGSIDCIGGAASTGTPGKRFVTPPTSTVYCVLPDPDAPEEALLIGTEGSGLFRLEKRTLRFTRLWPLTGDSLGVGTLMIYELSASRDGAVWIGTQDGLFRWRPHLDPRPTRIAADDINARAGPVFSVFEDSNAFLWIGTERGGLAYLDRLENQITFFAHRRGQAESIASNTVRCVYEDRQGRLWIGTSAGLDLMDVGKGTFRHLTTAEGLPNNVIYGILEDVSGYLWISTNRGLARYSPDEGVVATYDVHDGLQGNEFNTSAFFKSASGEHFFGGVRGVTHFYPERITRNLVVPPVVVTSVREGNNELLPRGTGYGPDTVSVDHDSKSIRLTFAALSYYRTEKNRYRYRIAGSGEEFIDLGTEHYLSFAGLSPGTYNIQIQGSNNDGVWNTDGATLTLVVRPPFWGTWWFRLILGLLLAIGAMVLLRWRLERLRRQERLLAEEVTHRTSELQHANAKLLREIEERKRAEAEAYRATATKSEFLAHISHEIRTPMNAILGFTELLQDRITDEEQRGHLNSIAVSGRTLLTLINDVLDLSKIEAGKLELSYQPASIRAIIQEIEQLFAYQVQRKNLEFVIVVAQGVPQVMYLDEIRIRQILLNLVGNAVKFTEKGSIRLEVGCSDAREERCTLNIRLADTGMGIAPSQQERMFEPFRQGGRGRNTDYSGTGLGLAITQRLVHMMEGEITYTSRLGIGTTFKVALPGVLIARQGDTPPQETEVRTRGTASVPDTDAGGVDIATTPARGAATSVLGGGASSAAVLAELHAQLTTEDLPRWERLQRTYLMHEIEDFALKLRAKGERVSFEPLREWADRLLRDARSFDMDQLPRTLSEFPGILAVLHDRATQSPSSSDTSTHD